MGGVSWEDSENIKANQCLWWYTMWDIMGITWGHNDTVT